MKRITLIFILFINLSLFAQNYELGGVTKVDSTSKNDLYLRAKSWVVENFKSANHVIQLDDAKNGVLIGKGWFEYNSIKGHFLYCVSGKIDFTVKIIVKEGRYKIMFYDFKHTGRCNDYSKGKSYGYITTSFTCPSYIEGPEKYNNEVWEDIRNKINLKVNDLSRSVKKTMKTPIVSDDW